MEMKHRKMLFCVDNNEFVVDIEGRVEIRHLTRKLREKVFGDFHLYDPIFLFLNIIRRKYLVISSSSKLNASRFTHQLVPEKFSEKKGKKFTP